MPLSRQLALFFVLSWIITVLVLGWLLISFRVSQTEALLVESEQPLSVRMDGELLQPSRRVQVDLLPRALDMAGSHVAILDPHRFVDTTW